MLFMHPPDKIGTGQEWYGNGPGIGQVWAGDGTGMGQDDIGGLQMVYYLADSCAISPTAFLLNSVFILSGTKKT